MNKAVNQYSYEDLKGLVFTKRQIRICRLLSQGYCFKEIASMQNIHLRSAHYSIKSAVKRNSAKSALHLIYLMAKKKII